MNTFWDPVLDITFMTLRSTVPILLASVGEIVTERSGVVNIGLEGILLLGAFFAVLGDISTGNPWIGVLIGALVGLAIGVMHGIISTKLKGNQVVDTIGVNTFALGVVGFGIFAVWHVWGARTIPSSLTIQPLYIAGRTLSPMVIIAFAIAIFTYWWLFKTSSGAALRACGEDPDAADVVGINVDLTRIIATVYGATLAGIGGAYLSVDWFSGITKEISAGRGWLALANVAFSNWNPLIAMGGSLIFAFFDALVMWIGPMQQVNSIIPQEILRTVPYIVTIIAISGVIKRVRPPKALGLPYSRE
jgi:ABC-type uncharacterized transport system permease subunit